MRRCGEARGGDGGLKEQSERVAVVEATTGKKKMAAHRGNSSVRLLMAMRLDGELHMGSGKSGAQTEHR
jgi:hypothetical protein